MIRKFNMLQAAYIAKKRPSKPTGAIIYDGPSLLDNSPIVVVALHNTTNRKTGNTIQTYIIRKDIDPLLANRTGQDYSICGNCPLRGTPNDNPSGFATNRSCYVALFQGPLVVYKSVRLQQYPDYSSNPDLVSSIGKDRQVRIGTYGDGSAVPMYVWDNLIKYAKGHTAYSHQALTPGSSFDSGIYMRSVQDIQEASIAWELGQRTFRVVSSVQDIQKNEIVCPASKEGGFKTQCANCGLCAGSSIKAKSIAIVAHGAGSGNVTKLGIGQ